MNIKKNLSDLAVGEPPVERDEAVPIIPLAEPQLGPLIVGHWFESRTHDDHLAHAVEGAGWYRGSYACSCTRQLWYKLGPEEPSNPNTIADHWRMDLGSMVHEQLQDAITKSMVDAQHEVKLDLNLIGFNGSMHADSVRYLDNFHAETIEIKSINGFGYKAAATKFKKTGPEGPRDSAATQGALAAVALQAASPNLTVTGARIVYLSLELVSPELAKNIGQGDDVSRFCAEWFIPFTECVELVEKERGRIDRMEQKHLDGEFVDGIIPIDVMKETYTRLKVVNPKTGAAVNVEGAGAKTWQCNYCEYQDRCIADHSEKEES